MHNYIHCQGVWLGNHVVLHCMLCSCFLCSLPGENFVSVDTNSLSILIEFALITGNFNNILDSLQILMGKLHLPDQQMT